jgi:hypothetical protein
MLLEPDVVQNLRHQRGLRIARHSVDLVLESNIRLASDLVEIDVGVGGFAKICQYWVYFVMHPFPGEDACHKEYHSDYPSHDVHFASPSEEL